LFCLHGIVCYHAGAIAVVLHAADSLCRYIFGSSHAGCNSFNFIMVRRRAAAADADGECFLLHSYMQGTLVMMPLLPLSLATANYGKDAMLFKPQRWMTGNSTSSAAADAAATGLADDAAGERDQQHHGAAAAAAAAKGSNITAPDPHTFMTGPRDCIGQALAKLELQVVLATLLARFTFLPGPKLQQELQVAAATGKPPVAALHALAGVHVTMQPEDGEMLLLVQPRS
jgi:hypothetical protein